MNQDKSIVISITSLDETLVTLSEDEVYKSKITAILTVKSGESSITYTRWLRML